MTPSGAILTFLSPNPRYSRSAVEFLNKIFNLPRINTESSSAGGVGPSLDELHFGSSSSSSWHSTALACPTSGTILHFLSFDDKNKHEKNDNTQSLHLIAIQGYQDPIEDMIDSSRQRLTDAILSTQSTLEARLRGVGISFMCNVVGRQINPSWIFANHNSPLFDLNPSHKSSQKGTLSIASENNRGKLRELALPFFPEPCIDIQTTLSKSSLTRPLPGLYQLNKGNNDGLILRPIPAAEEDLRLSPPSLVFQCESIADVQTKIETQLQGYTFKIGWRGHCQLGSLMVSHPSILGLDIRISETGTDDWVPNSGFDEAQDSLLAGSLEELQSARVVSEGKSLVNDEKTNKGDCWIETRANISHPSGFFRSPKKQAVTVAKPPSIPYE